MLSGLKLRRLATEHPSGRQNHKGILWSLIISKSSCVPSGLQHEDWAALAFEPVCGGRELEYSTPGHADAKELALWRTKQRIGDSVRASINRRWLPLRHQSNALLQPNASTRITPMSVLAKRKTRGAGLTRRVPQLSKGDC